MEAESIPWSSFLRPICFVASRVTSAARRCILSVLFELSLLPPGRARSAARGAARGAARSAARSAARCAARGAAHSAARSAARRSGSVNQVASGRSGYSTVWAVWVLHRLGRFPTVCRLVNGSVHSGPRLPQPCPCLGAAPAAAAALPRPRPASALPQPRPKRGQARPGLAPVWARAGPG